MAKRDHSPTYENLNDAGYLVVEGVLSSQECARLSKSLTRAVVDLIFTRQGFNVDPEDKESLDLLMDQNLREEKLGETAKTIVWRGGNTRQPLISKSCGMTHIHFNEDLLETITYNERLYDEAVKVMGTRYLVHSTGPERFCIKPRGATDMPQHIDSNPFVEEVNYPYRIQSLVTLQIDKDIDPRNSGTLCLLTYFHKYWDFARELFHPSTGLKPYRFPEMKSRFFVLPTNKKDRQHFDDNYLPALKKHAAKYAKYLTGERGAEDDSFYKILEKKGVLVPPEEKGYIEMMNWTPIRLAPGDMVFWHQYLPHRSVRQHSKIPRICAYYNLFPVSKEWYETSHCKWVQKQFKSCQFFYGVDAGKYPTNPVNIEEYETIKAKDGEIARLAELSTLTQFRRRISGQESYFDTEKTPQDVKDLCLAMTGRLKDKSLSGGKAPRVDIKKAHPNAVKLPSAPRVPSIFKTLQLPGFYRVQCGEIFGETIEWGIPSKERLVLVQSKDTNQQEIVIESTGEFYGGHSSVHDVYLRYNDTFDENEHCFRILEGPLSVPKHMEEEITSFGIEDDAPTDKELAVLKPEAVAPLPLPPDQLLFLTKHWSYAPNLIPDADGIYQNLLPYLEEVCNTYTVSMYGKETESRRISCIFVPNIKEARQKADAKSNGFDYTETPAYEWTEAPADLIRIRNLIEEFYGYKTDYVLCHVYRGLTLRVVTKNGKEGDVEEAGQEYIGWHNDKEALNSEVFSVSLGTPRKFQFRPLVSGKGFSTELIVGGGDVVHMFGPREGQKSCQRTYKHRVPQMSIADLVAHIESRGFTPPKGRKTYESLTGFISLHDIPPTRINLTFRQYEG